MKGRGAARAPGGREGEGGLQTRDRGPGARRPLSAARSPPPGSCGAATGTSARVGRAPAPASRRSCPGVPGCGRARAGARGRGRCPAARGRLWRPQSGTGAGPSGVPFRTVPPPALRPGRAAWVAMGSGSVSSGSLAAGTCSGVAWGSQGEG